jgi:hypothetical protein
VVVLCGTGGKVCNKTCSTILGKIPLLFFLFKLFLLGKEKVWVAGQ